MNCVEKQQMLYRILLSIFCFSLPGDSQLKLARLVVRFMVVIDDSNNNLNIQRESWKLSRVKYLEEKKIQTPFDWEGFRDLSGRKQFQLSWKVYQGD